MPPFKKGNHRSWMFYLFLVTAVHVLSKEMHRFPYVIMAISPGLLSMPRSAIVIKFLSVCLNHFSLETLKSFLIRFCSPLRGLLWFHVSWWLPLTVQRLLRGRPCVVFTFATFTNFGIPILLGGFITHNWFRSVNKATVELVTEVCKDVRKPSKWNSNTESLIPQNCAQKLKINCAKNLN